MFCSASVSAASVSGNLQKWSPLTIDFVGPSASETDNSPNPFLDYRLTVVLSAPSGKITTLPGFFAGNGQGDGDGNHWQARFSADEVGTWRYQATMHAGENIAINLDTSAGDVVALESASGEFTVQAHSTDAPGFERFGRLEYTGEHYLKFRDGPYWLKGGTDSPENFLGYEGFDGTIDKGGENFLHSFSTHRADASSEDPFFTSSLNGKDSAGITGALNYLSNQAVNSIYFLPMNLGGDGQETYPFVQGGKTHFNKTHYDISKLYQWNMVLSHAQKRGIALNIVLSETERENERWLDNGEMGTERKLFFRELTARFGYLLAAKWNLGEENDFSVTELRKHASYLKAIDWSNKPIAVHTQINNFRDYEELVGDSLFSATSIQYDPTFASEFVEQWRTRSAHAGRKWVVDMDENTGGISDKNADTRRKQILYDVYFSGGNLEWYFGYHSLPLGGDLTAGDFRKREAMWEMMRYARQFIEQNLPFWRMQDADELVSGADNAHGGAEVFADPGQVYAVYLPNASGNPKLDLSDYASSFSVRWYNPRNGQFEGNTTDVNGGQHIALGNPPSSNNNDWVVLVKSHNAQSLPNFSYVDTQADAPLGHEELAAQDNTASQNNLPETENAEAANNNNNNNNTNEQQNSATQETTAPNTSNAPIETHSAPNQFPVFLDTQIPDAIPGSAYSLSIMASDPDGVAPVITAVTLPEGMSIQVLNDGVATLNWQVPAEQSEAVSFELIAIDVADNTMQAKLPITLSMKSNAAQTDNVISTTDAIAPLQESVIIDDNEATQQTVFTVSDAQAFLAAQNLPPVIFGASDGEVGIDQTITMAVVPIDPEGIVASIRLADAPSGSQFVDNGNGSRTFVWTPTSDQLGETTFRFIATDAGPIAHVVQQTVTLNVVHDASNTDNILATENHAPVFVPVEVPSIKVGDSVSININPIDPDGLPPILHVNQLPTGASFNDNGDGSRTFEWTATADYAGTLHLDFTATDSADVELTVSHRISFNVSP